MSGIVISYRRADTRWIVGRIYDRLEAQFGRDAVFMDVDGIPLGQDFRVHIRAILDRCNVLLAIIGPHWLQGADGTRRIDDEGDWVRIEIETALEKNITVIPVLIDDARLPEATELPGKLRELAFRQAARLNTDVDFQSHMERLIRVLREQVGKDSGASTSPTTPESVRSAREEKGTNDAGTSSVAEKIATFSPIRFVVRWGVAAFLVYLGYEIFIAGDEKPDRVDPPSVSAPAVDANPVSAPAVNTPPGPGATATPDAPATAPLDTLEFVAKLVASGTDGKAAQFQWLVAAGISSGCWHRVSGRGAAAFGEYLRIEPGADGVTMGGGSDLKSVGEDSKTLAKLKLDQKGLKALDGHTYSYGAWTFATDLASSTFAVDQPRDRQGAGAHYPVRYEQLKCPE